MKYESCVLSLTSWGEKGRNAKEIYTPSYICLPHDISNESIENLSRIFPLVGAVRNVGTDLVTTGQNRQGYFSKENLRLSRSGFRGKPQAKKTNKRIKGK